IGAMNYCKTCHQFIWRPERRQMRYYLNESHPADEDYCEYHQESNYRQSAYGQNQPVRASAKSNLQAGGAKANPYTGSGADGKMTKADYLAKKAAQAAHSAAEAAKKANTLASSGQTAGAYRSNWKKMVEKQADKEQQKKKNPVM
ncbi:MAG: hypothetical protein Q4F76_12580, partial [Lachnospiraceae bacterium]|nr:hypothetical protein [Lachnospiraceae bacterium]